jgi:hypothetical protein
MILVYAVGIPIASAFVAGLPLSLVNAPWLVRICNWAIAAQVGLVLTAWLLLAVIPGEQNWRAPSGVTCPDFDTVTGELLGVVAYSSFGVGAVALASAFLAVRRRAARPGRLLAGLGASGVYLLIWIPLVFASLCGLS